MPSGIILVRKETRVSVDQESEEWKNRQANIMIHPSISMLSMTQNQSINIKAYPAL
jgi:hypothetical protein